MKIIQRTLKDGDIWFEGKPWRFEDLPFEPGLSGKLPIYIGAFADLATDRAAHLAGGFLSSGGGGALGKTYQKLREALTRDRRADEDFPHKASESAYVHEDVGRCARQIIALAIAYQGTRYTAWAIDRDKPRPGPVRPGDRPWERYLVGIPDEVAGDLARLYEGASYEHLCFWRWLPGVTCEQTLVNNRLFASEVVPRVREAVRTA